MPADDAQKVWFPELVEHLRSGWNPGMSFEALIALRDSLDSMLHGIRAAAHLRSPLVRCPRCRHFSPAAPPHVSVRSMILSLNRLEIAPSDQVYGLEKSWAVYRREHGLDPNGQILPPDPLPAACCSHAELVRRSG